MTRRIAVIAIALLTLTACDKGTPNGTPTAVTSLGAGGTPTAQPTATATATGQASPKASVTTAPPTGPRIVYFRIKTKANCQSHGPSVDYPGSVELEWEVAGGPTAVTISIDGPGVYSTYPIVHAEKYNFSCTETSNATTKHTYLLKTVGGGPVQQQTITAEAVFH
jgi:hypothetical protein